MTNRQNMTMELSVAVAKVFGACPDSLAQKLTAIAYSHQARGAVREIVAELLESKPELLGSLEEKLEELADSKDKDKAKENAA